MVKYEFSYEIFGLTHCVAIVAHGWLQRVRWRLRFEICIYPSEGFKCILTYDLCPTHYVSIAARMWFFLICYTLGGTSNG